MGKLINYLDGLDYEELVEELSLVSKALKAYGKAINANGGNDVPTSIEINGKVYKLARPVMILIDGLMDRIEQLESEARHGN